MPKNPKGRDGHLRLLDSFEAQKRELVDRQTAARASPELVLSENDPNARAHGGRRARLKKRGVIT